MEASQVKSFQNVGKKADFYKNVGNRVGEKLVPSVGSGAFFPAKFQLRRIPRLSRQGTPVRTGRQADERAGFIRGMRPKIIFSKNNLSVCRKSCRFVHEKNDQIT
jgi:hypothetical protein